ncbi:MAG: DEAD/DEAH box helicase family protein [Bacilli bacterium]
MMQPFLDEGLFYTKDVCFFYVIIMEDVFCCPLCGNTEPRYLGILNGKYYCRRCLSFRGKEAEKKMYLPQKINPKINYQLTEKQNEIAEKVTRNYQRKKNTLIYAVTGAGKTELVYQVIAHVLSKGLHVGFVIPRKDVVIELSARFKKVFPQIDIAIVYGGHNEKLSGQLIILTTHQLYRYPKYFDLLIFDEIDAFPYVDNALLEKMFLRSVKGNYVLMSATPSRKEIKTFKEEGNLLTLFERFHQYPLPVPQIVIRFLGFEYVYLIKKCLEWKKAHKPFLIFVPVISQTKTVFRILEFFLQNGDYVHSQRKKRNEIITRFKKRNLSFLVTTSVLERGVTIENLQVLIFNAHHVLFDSKTLIQISGRVGRKTKYPTGEIIFLANQKTPAMIEAIDDINRKNQVL